MELRTLGNTGLRVSVLGFGCGWVGGLMIKGSAADQARAVVRAQELGINYFDTAPHYGDGESERNLGRALADTGSGSAIVGTKTWVRVPVDGPVAKGIAEFILASIATSLRLLRRDSVDLLQLHNVLGLNPEGDVLGPVTVINEVVPVFERLKREGKVRAYGFTGLGDAAAAAAIIDSGAMATVQLVYNLLNDSAARAMPPGYPGQDYGRLLARAQARGVGALGIRAMAGGALSGTDARHPLALASVPPLGSGASYAADVMRARRLQPLVDEGHAGSLVEAAIRFATGNTAIASTMLGLSSLEQLETAAAAVNKGPLSAAAMARVAALQAGFVGEPR
jgi:L-galactose dehydrogenase/L-glyceraldehyde 3-phosphate reductase